MILQPSDIQAITPPILVTGGEQSEESLLYFDINRSILRPDSAARSFVNKIDSIAAENSLIDIYIEGSSSPDGPQALNERLARRRAYEFKSFITSNANVDDSLFVVNIIDENWEGLAKLYPPAADLIEHYPGPIKRESALRHYLGGRDWPMLRRKILPQLRYVAARARYYGPTANIFTPDSTAIQEIEYVAFDEPLERDSVVSTPVEQLIPEVLEDFEQPTPQTRLWQRHIYAKTNAPAWGMLWLNAACEVDIAPHWSGQLPIYYSGFNYFTSRRKFRTFIVMPEIRYWLDGDNQGFFAGAHLGFGFFNVAFEGDTRYQDHKGRRPAYGGGLNIGYRFNFCRNHRWKMEVSLGAGVYGLYYDTYQNKHNGLLTGTHHRTFFGIDNAAVSFCYQFDLKGGRVQK